MKITCQVSELLRDSLTNKAPLLILGAGFSLGSKNGKRQPIPTGTALANELFNSLLVPKLAKNEIADYVQKQKNEDLKFVCDIIEDEDLTPKRNEFLTQRMKGCFVNEDDYHMLLKGYPWNYIFSLNIDDLTEFIYKNEKIAVQINEHPNNERPALFKLHGSVLCPEYGYIFSSSEYRNFSASERWSTTLFGTEFVRNDVIFLGTEFQEDDLLVILEKYFNMLEITKNHRYFFISPSIRNRSLNKKISKNDDSANFR